MEWTVFVAMLASASMHATWNAWVKSRPDPGNAMVALSLGSGLPYLGVLLWVGLPARGAWPFIAGTVALSTASALILTTAYRHGDFAVAYPLVRGLIPVALVLAAVPLFHEVPSRGGVAGVVAVASGLLLVAWESARRSKTMTSVGLGLAAAAAALNATSALIDAQGARLAASPLAYAGTVAVCSSAFMAVTQVRRRDLFKTLRVDWKIAAFGALLSNGSYLLYVWSMARAPVAMVGAVRETSMLFALFIGAIALGERIGGWRVLAVALMLGGICLLKLS